MFIRFDDRRKRFLVDDSKIAVSSQLSTRWLLRCLVEVRHFAEGRLLDVGCGEKPYRGLFQSSHHIGMDWGKSPHSSDFVDVLGSAPCPPFKDEVFDTVLCTEVLEHLSTPSDATRALARVLKPGGHLILSVPFLHWIHEGPFDYFRYTEFGLRRLLDESGLEVVTMAHRGGAATVLVDVYARAMNLYTRQILGALHFPHMMIRVIDYLLISLPQRLAARTSFLVHRRMPDLTSRLDTSRQMTLGYVVVARKRSDVLHES